jgi:photosystem II stability/assembly factor-like uncharacterized protein
MYAVTGDAFARLDEEDGRFRVELSLVGSAAQCLAVDPARSETVYVGMRGRGVVRSDDAGRSWEDVFPDRDVFSVAVSAADGAVYAGCEPSMLFRSLDGGASWDELDELKRLPSAPTWSFPPRPWTSHVSAIAPSPAAAGVVLVGIELGGLMRTEDGGRTWADHPDGVPRDVHALAWHPTVPARAYEAAGDGAAWSADGGERWTRADDGRDRHYTWALAVDPDDPGRWFVSASPGPFQAHRSGRAEAFVYRREGESWQRLAGGLPQPLESMVYALAFGGERLFAGLRDGRLFASADRGDTWQQLELVGERLRRVVALARAE